ncbi:hypothetical protein BHU72_07280 [Desulfuribacillus stibiiarsenatis]|uniref:histidine kinase n=1 Tax=Desulfuribacillus stibiiarsenatis TaxID=1390249 RepID=A0A1E5L4E5_9FIRM|nr:sensor histidine kinase [Desulfuribacillus stibiiarsenatis]OEH84985.1 hypothetical protein BHU72_07280 [Desulfuribacillus stibiiarsenatis]
MNLQMENFIAILINVLSVSVYLFIIQSLTIKGKHNSWYDFIVASISTMVILLCMSFSVDILYGYRLDLRYVPFVIGSLYGGRQTAFILFILIIAYRYLLGGEGFYLAIITSVLTLVFVLFYLTYIHEQGEKTKLKAFRIARIVFFCCLLLVIISFSFSQNYFDVSFMTFLILFVAIEILAISTSIYYLEKTKMDIELANEHMKLEKLSSVSDIAASISHEIKNPLTVTRGFLQLLQNTKLSDEKRTTYIDLSLAELDRAVAIINDYLAFAKPSKDNIEILELNEQIKYILSVVSPFAMLHDVQIKFSQTGNIHIKGEKQKLHQALLNIIKNGIESIKSGGHVAIKLEEINNFAKVMIEDTGCGMSKEQIERLGIPYNSTKEKGTGLGLMVVFNIIKAMKGTVDVDSKIGKGTKFVIMLPKNTI